MKQANKKTLKNENRQKTNVGEGSQNKQKGKMFTTESSFCWLKDICLWHWPIVNHQGDLVDLAD